jgi:hypothetical protein
MATSPLFGWEEPDDTDLVKDGAAAIRTLGNAIDTSMGDLLGGTSGQVLSKNSNTNMDFTWVTSDDANAIQNTIVDAKGDLIAASASDVPARLAVGANGLNLFSDSTAGTGLKWDIPSGMTLISTTTLSGATTTISSIPQTYKTLMAVITGVTNATGNGLFRIDINGGATNNFYAGVYFQQGAAAAVYGGGYDYAVAGQGNWLRTDSANSLTFVIPNYTASVIKNYQFYGAYVQSGGGQYAFTSAGYNLDASATTSLIFSNTGGNLSTGTVKLYGVN